MVKVLVEPLAKEDIASIYRYIKYKLLSSQGANNFMELIGTEISRLADSPNIGRIDERFIPKHYRYLIAKRRYRIYYVVKEDICHVLSVWATLQDSDKIITKLNNEYI